MVAFLHKKPGNPETQIGWETRMGWETRKPGWDGKPGNPNGMGNPETRMGWETQPLLFSNLKLIKRCSLVKDKTTRPGKN